MSFLDPFGIVDKATDLAHEVTGIPTADERRQSQRLMNDQIKAYREQAELTRNEINKARDAQSAEKRRIDEKQIRALRRNYRSQGLLGTAQSGQQDMSSKLGG